MNRKTPGLSAKKTILANSLGVIYIFDGHAPINCPVISNDLPFLPTLEIVIMGCPLSDITFDFITSPVNNYLSHHFFFILISSAIT